MTSMQHLGPASRSRLDFTIGSISEWIAGGPPGFRQVVSMEESTENWVADLTPPEAGSPDGEIEAAVVDLGRALDENPAGTHAIMSDPAGRTQLRIVLSYLRASRRLRAVSWLVDAFGEPALKLMDSGDAAPAGGSDIEPALAAATAICSSLELVRRHHLLCAMFDPRRIQMVMDAIDEASRRTDARVTAISGSADGGQ